MAETPSDCAHAEHAEPAPTTPSALNAWLQQKTYRCWAKESEIHPSDGPHGGNVRVFLNETLDRSLRSTDASTEHPQGSVAVKELWGSGTTALTGWAVGVKTAATSDGGAGWYWYEVFSTAPNASGAIEGQNKPLCSGCHASGGRDFVLIAYPLR